MPETRTSIEICQRVMQYLDYTLTQRLSQVGTVGDRTTLRDIDQMAGTTIPQLRAQFPAEVADQLTDRDLAAIQMRMRETATAARTILENDSIVQRLERSIGSSTANAVDSARRALSFMVQGEYHEEMPPLPFTASRAPVGQRCIR